MEEFTFIDLFAGIGGFRLAAQAGGGRCLGFSEINSDAITTYCANFKEEKDRNFGDIRKIKELPHHDFLTAGVPCQSWSIAGKNLGFDDERGQLWDDALYLLKRSQPKAFIFENVKGLADPRNSNALAYILAKIKAAGYTAKPFLLNANDYGVPQSRVRIYIIGFKDGRFMEQFRLPEPRPFSLRLGDLLDNPDGNSIVPPTQLVLFSAEPPADYHPNPRSGRSLSTNNGENDYFLLNDIRNGPTTVHSWDIIDTTPEDKSICYLLLANRRKSQYGPLDGNPMSLHHLQQLDGSITQGLLDSLVQKEILRTIDYEFEPSGSSNRAEATNDELAVIDLIERGVSNISLIRNNRELKKRKIPTKAIIESLIAKGLIRSTEVRYDFKNSKISTGLYGVSRIFLPSSTTFPTLVASDTNDYVTNVEIYGDTPEQKKREFIEKIHRPGLYRKLTKEETCRIQGFPTDFILPQSRPRWMKLLGNSIAVPMVTQLCEAVAKTGVFNN